MIKLLGYLKDDKLSVNELKTGDTVKWDELDNVYMKTWQEQCILCIIGSNAGEGYHISGNPDLKQFTKVDLEACIVRKETNEQ